MAPEDFGLDIERIIRFGGGGRGRQFRWGKKYNPADLNLPEGFAVVKLVKGGYAAVQMVEPGELSDLVWASGPTPERYEARAWAKERLADLEEAATLFD